MDGVAGLSQRPIPPGETYVYEFVIRHPGTYMYHSHYDEMTQIALGAVHCHMTHHVMMQMGHGLPNMVGADTRKLDRRMSRAMPDYMTMGTTGMGGMGEMPMPMPPNSLPMRGGSGPFSYIDMGGMFTILKVRDDPSTADPNGWFQNPAGTVAGPASAEKMRADGIVSR
jgi:hypothetical protein